MRAVPQGPAIATIVVRRKPGDPCKGILACKAGAFPCALGRGTTSAFKREGDGATPVGRHRLLHGYFRAARGQPVASRLLRRAIRADDGWCDAPADASYNRPVRLPFRPSHETMMRADHLYDEVVVLDWNISRRRRNAGSAIFLHLARPGFTPTEGCVAVAAHVIRRLLRHVDNRTVLVVHR